MPPGADLSGKWTLVADAGGQLIDISVVLKQSGSDFTSDTFSHLGNGRIDNGKVNGNSISGVLRTDVQGQPVDFKMDGAIDGNKLTGLAQDLCRQEMFVNRAFDRVRCGILRTFRTSSEISSQDGPQKKGGTMAAQKLLA